MARGKPNAGEDNPFKPLEMPPASAPRSAVSSPPPPAPAPPVSTRLEDIAGIDPRIPEALRAHGYGDLWPSQQEAAPIAVAGGHLVLAVPTASGKSMVAYLALLSRALKGAKGLYIVPLRALASEKHEDLKALCGAMGLRAGLAIGDLDAEDPQLARFDVIVATSEKADALTRHKAAWMREIGCIVADEVHLLGDADRGPTLEVLLSRFKQLNPSAQIVALSATVGNSREMAQWLGAAHVKTEWRPVTLKEGILYGRAVQWLDNTKHEVKSDLEDPALALAQDAAMDGAGTIVFVGTRKSTEALAEKLAGAVKPHVPESSLAILKEAASKLKGGSDETSVEKKLAKCLAGGAAFHHAGLRNAERTLVERLFKEGHVKALAATPTLAAGVNLPARRVVVRDLFRYDVNEGNKPIPVLEYKQMAGRAGRPRYDKVGEAITIAKTAEQRSEIALSFLLAEPEKVRSQLGSEKALRTHVLSSIATEFVRDEAELKAFLRSTFHAHTSDAYVLDQASSRVIDFLLENDLVIAEGDGLSATRFGKRVSELYIDPMSAVKLRKALTRVDKVKKLTPLSFLHAICATPDVLTLYTRRGDAWLEAEAIERDGELLLPPGGGVDYEFFLQELKTACLLNDWIEELDDEALLKKYNAYPGDVHNKVESANWLLHAMEEIARIFRKDAIKPISQVAARVATGARAEILPLLELRGVGRFRARKLYDAGYYSRERLAAATARDLAAVPGIGLTLAAAILEQLGRDPAQTRGEIEAAAATQARAGQTSLGDF